MRKRSVTGWALVVCLTTVSGNLQAQERRPENRIDLDEVASSSRVTFDGLSGEPGVLRGSAISWN